MTIVYRSYCLNCSRFIHEEEDSHFASNPDHVSVNLAIDDTYASTVENDSGYQIGAPTSGTPTVAVTGFDTIEDALNFIVASGIAPLGSGTPTTLSGFDNLEDAILQNSSDISDNYSFIQSSSGSLQSAIDGKVSLTGDELIQGVKTFDNDVFFRGNFAVSGTQTVIHTQELEIEDNIITLNSTVTGTPTLDAGIVIERGNAANVELLWNESQQRFEAGPTGTLEKVILFPDLVSTSGVFQALINSLDSDITIIESDLSTSSGSLQTQVNINSSDISGLQADVNTNLSLISAASGSLQSQISSNDSDISTIEGDIITLQSDVSQNTFDIASTSGVLQSQVSANDSDIGQLQSDLTTTSGNLQTDINTRVLRAGDTMTGFLTLHADPTTSGHAVTKQYVDSEVSAVVASLSINQSFQDENGPGIQTVSTTYETMNYLIFAGTNSIGNLSSVDVVVDVSATATTGQVRIYDLTNAQTIAEGAIFSNQTPTLLSLGTISNLPSGQAIWELQVRKTAGSGSKAIRLYAISLNYGQ